MKQNHWRRPIRLEIERKTEEESIEAETTSSTSPLFHFSTADKQDHKQERFDINLPFPNHLFGLGIVTNVTLFHFDH